MSKQEEKVNVLDDSEILEQIHDFIIERDKFIKDTVKEIKQKK